ncbi:hypothetical protein SAMN05216571_101148 [Onishia taeanensis]|uniref:Uncharacterized protein n=1 Tax=Onishia taeanensis TaxID=284577 RepID=A0A1G7N1G3_9GAMM|nr:hypothetical protein SAMN05216571_101148 [Halomonas taeanensis]
MRLYEELNSQYGDRASPLEIVVLSLATNG